MFKNSDFFDSSNWKIEKKSNPYPYAQIDNFLTTEMHNKVKENFPDLQHFNYYKNTSKNNNVAVTINFKDLNAKTDTFWYKFGGYFVKDEFFYNFCEFYIKDIKRLYPHIYKRIKRRDYKIGIYNDSNSFDHFDVLLDFAIGINTPVTQCDTVRGAHLDNKKSLYTALCYLKDDDDLTDSGHFVVYDLKPNKSLKVGKGRSINYSDVTEIQKIKYKSNRLATFVNSKKSIHGVTPREVTDKLRKYFTFNAVFKEDLYKLPLLNRVQNFFSRYFK